MNHNGLVRIIELGLSLSQQAFLPSWWYASSFQLMQPSPCKTSWRLRNAFASVPVISYSALAFHSRRQCNEETQLTRSSSQNTLHKIEKTMKENQTALAVVLIMSAGAMVIALYTVKDTHDEQTVTFILLSLWLILLGHLQRGRKKQQHKKAEYL